MDELKARNRLPASQAMSSRQADMGSKYEEEEDDDDEEDIGPNIEDKGANEDDEDEEEDDMIGPSIDFNEKDSNVRVSNCLLGVVPKWGHTTNNDYQKYDL